MSRENNWKKDLANSSINFETVIWPKIKNFKLVNGQSLINCEFSQNEYLKLLDKLSGIDFLIQTNNNEIISLASRVQKGYNYSTFTIRSKRHSGTLTEFEKRNKEIKSELFIYPKLTCQAYLKNNGDFFSVAIIKTKDLYLSILKKQVKVCTNQTFDGNLFYFIDWFDLKNLDLSIEFIYKNKYHSSLYCYYETTEKY